LNRAVDLIQNFCGGKIVKGLVDFYPKRKFKTRVKIRLEKIRKYLGTKISRQDIRRILTNLGFDFKYNTTRQNWQVEIPTYRLDIKAEHDLIEEIGRLYGYEKIVPVMPSAALVIPKRNKQVEYENKIKDILVGLGFNEVYNYSLIGLKEMDVLKFKHSQIKKQLIEVNKPISQDKKYLRNSLLPLLIKNACNNLKFFGKLQIFEIGKIFRKKEKNEKNKPPFLEKKMLAGIIVDKDTEIFYLAKGIIDLLGEKLGLNDIWYDDEIKENLKKDIVFLEEGRRAEIKIGEESLGWIGEISHDILENLALKQHLAVFEIDFDLLVRLAIEEKIYIPPIKYPSVVRDIAILVDQGTKVAEVLNLINVAGGSLVRDVDLFDMYEGSNLPDGRKSLAFHIIYQADDHTLTDEEVNKIHKKIIEILEKEGGWEVRK